MKKIFNLTTKDWQQDREYGTEMNDIDTTKKNLSKSLFERVGHSTFVTLILTAYKAKLTIEPLNCQTHEGKDTALSKH